MTTLEEYQANEKRKFCEFKAEQWLKEEVNMFGFRHLRKDWRSKMKEIYLQKAKELINAIEEKRKAAGKGD